MKHNKNVNVNTSKRRQEDAEAEAEVEIKAYKEKCLVGNQGPIIPAKVSQTMF